MQGTATFFEHQDRARQNTLYLLGLFALALFGMTLLLYLMVTITMLEEVEFRLDVFFQVAFVVVLFVGFGSLSKLQSLKAGGSAVAISLGGQLVSPDTQDPAEAQLLNVVEEMAIASGITVPAVYRLPDEPNINAFAAGFTPNDAVIGVTQGTLDQLNRDELQGVIAHEFSHILNGDMRLNLRLIGILQGILLIYLIGRTLARVMHSGGSSRSSRGGGIAILGLGMIGIGALGLFCGRLIKSAVSRQREFLADASAVQFTRNPSGLLGALKKIGGLSGSRVRSPNAEEASHLFFGEALRLGGAFATHPPMKQRIRRLEALGGAASIPASAWDAETPATPSVAQNIAPDLSEKAEMAEGVAMGLAGSSAGGTPGSPVTRVAGNKPHHLHIDPDQVVETVGTTSAQHLDYAHTLLSRFPSDIREATRTKTGAMAIIYGFLLDDKAEVRDRQLTLLKATTLPEILQRAIDLHPKLCQLDPRFRLPLLDLTIPALRTCPPKECSDFLKVVQNLVKADQRVTLGEYTLQVILHRRLAAYFNQKPPKPPEFKTIEQIWPDCIVLLSALAFVGHGDRAQQDYAFRSGMFRLPGAGRLDIPQTLIKLNIPSIGKSLKTLDRTTPKLKQAFIDACAHTVLVDNDVTLQEAELLRTVVIALDCPIPPFLDASLK